MITPRKETGRPAEWIACSSAGDRVSASSTTLASETTSITPLKAVAPADGGA